MGGAVVVGGELISGGAHGKGGGGGLAVSDCHHSSSAQKPEEEGDAGCRQLHICSALPLPLRLSTATRGLVHQEEEEERVGRPIWVC